MHLSDSNSKNGYWQRALSKAQKVAHKRGITCGYDTAGNQVLTDLKGRYVEEYNVLLDGFCDTCIDAFRAITQTGRDFSPPYDDRFLRSSCSAFD